MPLKNDSFREPPVVEDFLHFGFQLYFFGWSLLNYLVQVNSFDHHYYAWWYL